MSNGNDDQETAKPTRLSSSRRSNDSSSAPIRSELPRRPAILRIDTNLVQISKNESSSPSPSPSPSPVVHPVSRSSLSEPRTGASSSSPSGIIPFSSSSTFSSPSSFMSSNKNHHQQQQQINPLSSSSNDGLGGDDLVKPPIDPDNFTGSNEFVSDDEEGELHEAEIPEYKDRLKKLLKKISQGTFVQPIGVPEPKVPQLIQKKIEQLGSTTPLEWVNEKAVTKTDINSVSGRLNLPSSSTVVGSLKMQEKNLIYKEDKRKIPIPVTVVDQRGETTEMEFKDWTGTFRLSGRGWKKFVAKFKLQADKDKLQIWCFRKIISNELCFAINILREGNVEDTDNPGSSSDILTRDNMVEEFSAKSYKSDEDHEHNLMIIIINVNSAYQAKAETNVNVGLLKEWRVSVNRNQSVRQLKEEIIHRHTGFAVHHLELNAFDNSHMEDHMPISEYLNNTSEFLRLTVNEDDPKVCQLRHLDFLELIRLPVAVPMLEYLWSVVGDQE